MIEFETINLISILAEFLGLLLGIVGSFVVASLSVSLLKMGVMWIVRYVR